MTNHIWSFTLKCFLAVVLVASSNVLLKGEDFTYTNENGRELHEHELKHERKSLSFNSSADLVWQESNGHTEIVSRIYIDNNVAIYYDSKMDKTVLWPIPILSHIWLYILKTYGSFFEDTFLYVILHSEKYNGCRASYELLPSDKMKNSLDCGQLEKNAWSVNTGNIFLIFAKGFAEHVNSKIIDHGSFRGNMYCGRGLMQTVPYDIFVQELSIAQRENLHLHDEQRTFSSFKEQLLNGNYLRKYCFRDWFLPIYEYYGGGSVINRFFSLTKLRFNSETRYYGTLDQVINYWSEAAGVDLHDLAHYALQWKYPKYNQDPNRRYKKGSTIYEPSTAWHRTWNDHNDDLIQVYNDDHISFFFENGQIYPNISYPFYTTSLAWQKIKQNYGPFGPDPYLHIVLSNHEGSALGCKSSNEETYSEKKYDFQHVIECYSDILNKWTHPRNYGWLVPGALNEILQEISIMALKMSKGVGNWPAKKVSNWTMSSIIVYDTLIKLGRNKDAEMWKEGKLKERQHQQLEIDNFFFGSNHTGSPAQWFHDWYFEIYSSYNGTTAINGFLSLVHAHWPQTYSKYSEDHDYFGQMNMGEFVHFWSWAVNKDLGILAAKCFGWNQEFRNELKMARIKFHGFNYSYGESTIPEEDEKTQVLLSEGQKSITIRIDKIADLLHPAVPFLLILTTFVVSFAFGVVITFNSRRREIKDGIDCEKTEQGYLDTDGLVSTSVV